MKQRVLKRMAAGLAIVLAACQGGELPHGETTAEVVVKGSHGGRLLEDQGVQTEVTIFERGVPPQFRVYVYENGAPVDPSLVDLTIELLRFGGRKDVIRFAVEEDYLAGDQVVVEPHSFDVIVSAQYKGQSYRWQYESYEGRTEMSDEAAQSSGIEVEEAGPATIADIIEVFGRIGPNEDRLKDVAARFPGIVKEARKRLGENVAQDEVLAIIESNESLQRFEVKSALTGTVIVKNMSPGEFAREGEPIYTVADLTSVWVDFNIPRKHFDRLKLGQTVRVSAEEGSEGAQGRISYISPFGALDTQTMLARVELPNPDRRWRPGLFVVGEIIVDESTVPLAVKAEALQTFRDWDVVFLRDGTVFEIGILELGRRDADWVEVISGLSPGQRYATENSFIIKADIGKSGATHDH